MAETNQRARPAEAPTDRWIALVYHDVLPHTTAAGGGPQRFDVPLASFESTLDAIADAGYRGCSLADAMAHPGTRRVAITFDDGTAGQYLHAAPALRDRGMTATFYVTTDWVGTPGFVTWEQLREMIDWGMSIQAHTRSHPFLSELGAEQLRAELVESKAALDRELAQDTIELAFPGGDAPRRSLRGVVAECGFPVVVGTRWGWNHDGSARAGRWNPVRRCTMRGDVPPEMALRIASGDPALARRRYPRETVLRALRSTLGPTRYARWRRRFLDRAAGPEYVNLQTETDE